MFYFKYWGVGKNREINRKGELKGNFGILWMDVSKESRRSK